LADTDTVIAPATADVNVQYLRSRKLITARYDDCTHV